MPETPSIQTAIGFRDITSTLAEDSLKEIRKYDVVRDIEVEKGRIENHGGKPEQIFYFYNHEYRIRGRIFSMDEIVKAGSMIDIIVQSWKQNSDPLSNLDVQVYHDFWKGEKIQVRISRRETDPSFKVFNRITGFVKPWAGDAGLYSQIQVGTAVLVQVREFRKNASGRMYVMTAPIAITG